MTIGLTKHTSLGIDEADEAVRQALAAAGFGVLTEIDVQATLRDRIGVERSPLRILGACNPHLAHEALSKDDTAALLLPCNVTLSSDGEGTKVSIVDPTVLLGVLGTDDELGSLAADAQQRLAKALSEIPDR